MVYNFLRRNMPDIEGLMQEWPPGFEDALRDVRMFDRHLMYSTMILVNLLCSWIFPMLTWTVTWLNTQISYVVRPIDYTMYQRKALLY